ncbi:MAG TPA: hypothetical protein VE289_02115 [Gaiellaceae bacterium]|nr:hypothetical protein [Gaiellaceae bacterium]
MDAEQRVSERLERIEALQRGRASEGALLAELGGLLEDGEAFLAAGTAGAQGAVSVSEGPEGLRRLREGGGAEGVIRASI